MSPKTKKQKTAGSPPAIAVSPTQSLPTLLPAPPPIAASMPLPSPIPLSAVAARRQKLLEAAAATLASALATNTAASPENDPEEHADVDDLGGDDDEKESLKSKESGDTSEDSQSSDPDSSSEEEDGRPVGVPRSKGAATSNHGIRRERKVFMDRLSVSTFQPTSNNTAFLTDQEDSGLLLLGMKLGESIVFQGCIRIIPLVGDSTAVGYTMSGTARKQSQCIGIDSLDANDSLDAKSSNGAGWDTTSLSEFSIFSPRTHALAVIESVNVPMHTKDTMVPQYGSPLSQKIGSLLGARLSEFMATEKFDSVIALRSAYSSGIIGVEKVVPLFKGIFTLKNVSRTRAQEIDESDVRARFETCCQGFYPIMEPTENIAALKTSKNWSDAIQVLLNATEDENGMRVKRPPVAVVCGGKKMGKSTFSRLLLNSMLNRHRKVAFIECDVGQSEFTPVGMVSLHIIDNPALGVPFTHLRQPYRAFFAGNSTPRDDPDYYMDCIRELVRTYYSEIACAPEWQKHDSTNGDEDFDDYQSDDDDNENFIPLIINTQGWIKGMGYDLLMQLLDYTAPSHIFGLYSPSSSDLNLPPQFFTVVNAQTQMDTTSEMLDSRSSVRRPVFTYVSAAIIEDSNRLSPFTKYHPADHRALSLISYFYLKQEDNSITTSTSVANEVHKNKVDLVWDFGHALVVRRPWCWDWTHAKGIWVLFEQVPPSQILYALNGSLVALIGDKEQSPKHENATGRRHGEHSKEGPSGGASKDDNRTTSAVKGSEETTKNAPPNYFPLGQFPPPPPKHTNCYGLAIIRSIEPSTRTFHLLTPIRQQILEKCNGVVKGALHMPLHTSLDHNDEQNYENGVAGVPWKKVPYLHYEGALGSIVQGGGAGVGTGGGTGGQSPAAGSGSSSPRLGFAPPVKIIGADAKSTRKNLGRKRLQAAG